MRTNSPLLVLAINNVMREVSITTVLEDAELRKKVLERIKKLHAFYLEVHKDCDVFPFYFDN